MLLSPVVDCGMISTRFGRLASLSLSVFQDGQAFVCRVPHSSIEIDDAIDILNEFEHAHVDDLSEYAGILPPGGWPPQDRRRFRRYKAREVGRVGSYVVFSCTLEGVIVRKYRELLSSLRRFSEGGHQAVESMHAGAVEQRHEEMVDSRTLRNKVFAHTSFADPRDDSVSLQVTSLAHFSGSMPCFTGGRLRVGGASVHIENEDPVELPMVGMDDLASKMATHVESWFGMYRDVMEAFLAVTDDDYKANWPAVHMVARRGPDHAPVT